ncbi:MAG TPA: helical backbone metal receptor [Ferruginibacter sp.]|nr:helical backbone metal receptor [Ferruginibacter sp.]HMP21757.1 helical backbone metal receptor [Ferruginibacter sp.]
MLLQAPTPLPDFPKSIVSLVPSITDLLYALGLESRISGITKFCVHPGHLRQQKQIIGGTKNINTSAIKACRPDLIIASREENTKEQVEALARDYPVWLTDVVDFETAIDMINDIGALTHSSARAGTIIQKIQQAFAQLQPIAAIVNTCYLIWRKPYMTVGGDTFIHAMLQQCGLQNIFADRHRYPAIDLQQLKENNCQLLLLSSEPYPFTQIHLEALKRLLPGITILLVDGEMFSWYGSKMMEAPVYFNQLIATIQKLTGRNFI